MKLVTTRYFRNQTRLALVGPRGRKWSHVVSVDMPVKVVKVANKDADKYFSDTNCFLGDKFRGDPIKKIKRELKDRCKWTYGPSIKDLPKNLRPFISA